MQSFFKVVSCVAFVSAVVACSSDPQIGSLPVPVGAQAANNTDAGAAPTVDEVEVVGGVPDRGQDPAVIAIDIAGEALCSGTLIAPRVVMTARHCVSQTTEQVACPSSTAQIQGNRAANTLGILVGDNVETATLVAKGSSLVVPSSDVLCNEDIALIVLDQDVTGITPVSFGTSAPKVAGHVRSVGYGMTSDNSGAGVKYLREHVAIQAVDGSEFEVGEATCQGDSGGPALDEDTSAVIGVVSRGGPACTGAGVHNIYTRVDAFLPLIAEALKRAGEDSPSTGKGAKTGDAGTPGSTSKPPSDVGSSCTKASDCASGVCVTTGSKKYCSRDCGSGDRCPDGYHCEKPASSTGTSDVCTETSP